MFDHFQHEVTLTQAAAIASMNPPAFCYYFKKRTQRSFSEFVNEVRLGHACKLLMGTDKTVSEICYESGFNTLAYFNRRFQRSHQISPTAYRMQVGSANLR
ncbi:MAG: AraC family transcriptional regulator [Sphingobacteriales bacterium]|nr:MAG: AraC family transcriptional regulator [Sphingobacteriales bacterium]